ncbi:hypothetical protein DPEC_G00085330 [Dallia pectoralis]|uniref:Uncharacterized protein n=1 Tax=Dallia pectoralis TaxID=75939 RepID=A0ACC2H0L4_DALPE|nr:hypothetical protein DPEC_G00085330 [Dallia pectoralis]
MPGQQKIRKSVCQVECQVQCGKGSCCQAAVFYHFLSVSNFKRSAVPGVSGGLAIARLFISRKCSTVENFASTQEPQCPEVVKSEMRPRFRGRGATLAPRTGAGASGHLEEYVKTSLK